MEKADARKGSTEALHARRTVVIDLYRQGVRVMKIVEHTGLSWGAVSKAITLFKAGGDQALVPEARGRKQGTGRSLTAAQEADVRQFIRTRRPRYYRLKANLWTRVAVVALIEQKCGVTLSERCVGDYLKRWGLSLKNAKKPPYTRCTKAVQTWLDAHYRDIEQQASERDAEIYWVNTPVALDSALWRPKTAPKNPQSDDGELGKTPKKLSMVSVVTNQGKLLWAINKGSFGADRQIKFIEALQKDTKRKVLFLIVSDQTSLRSEELVHWIRQNSQSIKIFPDRSDVL